MKKTEGHNYKKNHEQDRVSSLGKKGDKFSLISVTAQLISHSCCKADSSPISWSNGTFIIFQGFKMYMETDLWKWKDKPRPSKPQFKKSAGMLSWIGIQPRIGGPTANQLNRLHPEISLIGSWGRDRSHLQWPFIGSRSIRVPISRWRGQEWNLANRPAHYVVTDPDSISPDLAETSQLTSLSVNRN